MSTKYEFGQVTLEDFSVDVKNVIRETAITFLMEAVEEIKSMTIRNTARNQKVGQGGQTAGSWQSVVDEKNLVGHVGSDYPNAIWEEFGTGSFAEKGDGRKDWWVYVEGHSSGTEGGGKHYTTLQEAKKAMAILRKKGLPAHVTRGKHARKPFRNAFDSSKPKIIRHAEQLFGGALK